MIKKQRLSKVLAAAGIASRRACEALIFEGKVTVNGQTVYVPQTFVSLESDYISVLGKKVTKQESKVYYLLNKPKGYICSNKAVGKKKLAIDLFKAHPERLFTVGRLDRDTTGLLIVTNDGHFAHKVIHPSSEIAKEYLIRTDHEITHEHLQAISQGTTIEGTWVKPVRVKKVRKGTLRITIMEGKKREVRILVQNAGLQITELKRIRLGGLLLGSLPIGKYRELTPKEREQIFE
jgi:23S rRNA pseudouridine2605 synthase